MVEYFSFPLAFVSFSKMNHKDCKEYGLHMENKMPYESLEIFLCGQENVKSEFGLFTFKSGLRPSFSDHCVVCDNLIHTWWYLQFLKLIPNDRFLRSFCHLYVLSELLPKTC